MLNLNRIEEVIEDLLAENFAQKISFPASELADAAIAELSVKDQDEIKRIRKECDLILRAHEDLFVSGDKVYPKDTFFNGTELRIVPTGHEIEKAILFPGAAFIPFCSNELFSDEFELKDQQGNILPVMEVQSPYNDLLPSFLMLGPSGIVDHLSAESEENRMLLRGAKTPDGLSFRLSAFDLAAFYRDNSFQNGDAVIIRVEDWSSGKFRIVRIERHDQSAPEEEKSRFVRDFEHALIRVCQTERDYMEIPEQIAEAYLFAFEDDHDLRKRPVLSLEEYRLRMNEIGIKRDGSEWLLVPADDLDTPGQFEQSLLRSKAEQDAKLQNEACSCTHDHKDGECHCHDHKNGECHCHDHKANKTDDGRTLDPDLDPNNFTISGGTLESIDAILSELNAPVNSVELGAMIYDSLANGEDSFNGFCSRIMDFMELKFVDDAQEVAFLNFLEENWEMAQEYFSPTEDAMRAPLRTRLLDLTKMRIEYSVRLLERYQGKENALPKKTVSALANIHRDICDTLAILNSENHIGDEAEYEQLELRIGDIEDAWDDFNAEF